MEIAEFNRRVFALIGACRAEKRGNGKTGKNGRQQQKGGAERSHG